MPKKSPDSSTNHNIRTIHEERIRNLIRNAEEQNILIQLDGISYGQGNLPLKNVLMELMGIKSEHVYNDYKRHKLKAPSELVPSDAKGAYIRNIRLRTPQVDHLFEPAELNYFQTSEYSTKIIKEIKKEVKRVLHAIFYVDTKYSLQYSCHHINMAKKFGKVSTHELRFKFWWFFFSRFIFKSEFNSISKELFYSQYIIRINAFDSDNVDSFCFNSFFEFLERYIFRYSDDPINTVFQPVYNHIKNVPYLYHKEKRPLPTTLRDLWTFPADFVFHHGEDCIKLAKKKVRYLDFKHKNKRRYNDIAHLLYLNDLEKALTIRSFKKFVNREILRGRFDIFFSSNAVDTSFVLQNVTYREMKQILAHYDISSSLQKTLASDDLLLLSEPLFRLRRGSAHQCDTSTFLETLKAVNSEKISTKILALLE